MLPVRVTSSDVAPDVNLMVLLSLSKAIFAFSPLEIDLIFFKSSVVPMVTTAVVVGGVVVGVVVGVFEATTLPALSPFVPPDELYPLQLEMYYLHHLSHRLPEQLALCLQLP